MEEKANRFIDIIVKKLDLELLKTSQSEAVFKSVIDDLKTGSIKRELSRKGGEYRQLFDSLCKNRIKEHQKIEEDNFVELKKSCIKMKNLLDRITLSSNNYSQFIQLLLKGSSKNSSHPELCALGKMLCSRDDLQSLTNVMSLTLSVLQPDVESCLNNGNISRCNILLKELHNILRLFHMKRVVLSSHQIKFSGIAVPYEDIMASLLSLYVDLFSFSNRSEVKVESGDLCGFVCYLLSPHVDHIIDVLLQLTDLSQADLILPLTRKCLLCPPTDPDCKLYSKYMVSSHMIIKQFGGTVTDIYQKAESLPAPLDFMNWLRDRAPHIVDLLPEDRKFKGRVISRFLLQDADQSLLESLLDSLTEELPNFQTCVVEDTSAKSPSSSEPLFYIDTLGGSNQPGDAELNDESHVLSLDNQDDTEVIEVDLSGFNLGQKSGESDKESDLDKSSGENEDESETCSFPSDEFTKANLSHSKNADLLDELVLDDGEDVKSSPQHTPSKKPRVKKQESVTAKRKRYNLRRH